MPDLHHPTTLAWGRRYALVDPSAYRIAYAINPFMDPAVQPDRARTRSEWEALVAAIRAAGAEVEVIDPLPDAPDMVYAMNLGLALQPAEPEDRPTVLLSHMRYAERRLETPAAHTWFEAAGFTPAYVGRDAFGPHFEAGDAFPWRGDLVVGVGPRTEESALPLIAETLDVTVRGVRIVHPAMYHLDLAFCPLDTGTAIICPEALDPASADALLELVPDPVVVTAEEATTTFCANSVVVGRTVLMPAGPPPRVVAELAGRGFDVVPVEVGELHLGGGSVRCMTNPLDIALGRDLAILPGGAVVLPPAEETAA